MINKYDQPSWLDPPERHGFVRMLGRSTLCKQQHEDVRREVGEWKDCSKQDYCGEQHWEWEEKFLTSELLSNHQKKVNVLVWLGQTTTLRLASFPRTATIGAERYIRSTGPEAETHTPPHTHVCIQISAPTHKRHTYSANMENHCEHRWCTFNSTFVFCTTVSEMKFSRMGTWLSMTEKGFMLYALPREWVMMFLIHILVMCKNSVTLSDPWPFSAEAVTR